MPISPATHFVGSPVTSQSAAGPTRLNAPAEPAFTLYFVPGAFTIMGNAVRPQLKKLIHQAGVDNVEQGMNGRGVSIMSAIARKVHEKGAIVINPEHCPAEMTPDGQAGYLRRYEGIAGPIYAEAWRRPSLRGRTVVWTTDDDGYRAWLDSLMESGVIPYPDETVYEDLMTRAQHAIGVVENRKNAGAAVEDAAARAQGQVDILTAAQTKPTRRKS